MLTRADITGAIKLMNAAKVPNRREMLQHLLEAEHSGKQLEKIKADVETYPEWIAGLALDSPPAPAGV